MTEQPQPDTMKWTAAVRERYADLLRQKTTQGCPRCGAAKFSLVDGYVNLPLSSVPFPTPHYLTVIPSVAAFCQNCGFLCVHSIVALEQSPTAKGEKENERPADTKD